MVIGGVNFWGLLGTSIVGVFTTTVGVLLVRTGLRPSISILNRTRSIVVGVGGIGFGLVCFVSVLRPPG